MDVNLTPLTAQQRGRGFGRYRLIKRLAFGGMAEVYLAQLSGAASFSKLVVVKLVLPHCAEDPEFLELFRDEGCLAARLSHPNIAQTFEMGEAEGRLYIAMEYVPGETVHTILRRAKDAQKPIPLRLSLHVVLQLLSALEYAHSLKDEHGDRLYIVHRDVSPSNLMVTYDGTAKLVDFGIARAVIQHHRTGLGFLKGKPAYMAPEQQSPGPIDRRADIFSAGSVLYELTTGRRAFDQATPLEVLQAVRLAQFPEPRSIDKEFPADLQRIILKAMARSPDQRYQTASAFQHELGVFASSIGMFPGEAEFGDYMRELFKQHAPREVAEANAIGILANGAMPHDAIGEQDKVEAITTDDILTYAMPPSPELLDQSKRGITNSSVNAAMPTSPPKRRNAVAWQVLALGSALAVCEIGLSLGIGRAFTPTPPNEPIASRTTDSKADLNGNEAHREAPPEQIDPSPLIRPPIKAARPRAAAKAVVLPSTGRLKLECTSAARVTERGDLLGVTPLDIELPAGEHILTLENDSRKMKRTLTLTIVGGEVTRHFEVL